MRIFPMAILAIAALFSNASPAVARDCIGTNGGAAICTPQQFTEWRYNVEPEFDYPTDMRAACIGRGGDWDDGTASCTGMGYPEEDTVSTMATAIAGAYYGCGVNGVVGDTGWGNFSIPKTN